MPAAKKAPPAVAITSIHDALQQARIELCGAGISKDNQAPDAVGGYKFRGIDDIYNVIGPLMAKYGISMTPQVVNLNHHTYDDEVKRNGRNGSYTQKRRTQHYVIQVQYVLAHGSDPEKIITACVFGEAMDTADKAMNKAMTSAYKNAVFQLFAPPLAGTPMDMDGGEAPIDSESDVVDTSTTTAAEPPPAAPPQEPPAFISAEDAKAVEIARNNAGIDEASFFAWIKVKKGAYTQIPAAKLEKINEVLKEKIREKSVADAKALADQKSTNAGDDLDDDIPF